MATDETVSAETLEEMAGYYRARATEYDEWFERRGRYDQGPAANARWFAEAAEAFAALDALAMGGDVLELASGTGIWTERLLRTAASVTAVDASPEMVAINRARVADDRVQYVLADLFAWRPARVYDGVCFGFWLSHVPRERLDAFLGMVASALRPGGALFFVDSQSQRASSATSLDQRRPQAGTQLMTRWLNDGREYRIVKNFYDPALLTERCAAVALEVAVRETSTYFLYGVGSRRG